MYNGQEFENSSELDNYVTKTQMESMYDLVLPIAEG